MPLKCSFKEIELEYLIHMLLNVFDCCCVCGMRQCIFSESVCLNTPT